MSTTRPETSAPSERLVAANVTAASGSLRQDYDYDEYGNMISTEMPGFVTPIPTHSPTNRLNGSGVQYDSAGNLTQSWSNGRTITYKYDSVNMLQQLSDTGGSNIAYVYTADDQRIWSFDLAANVSHWVVRDLEGKVLRDFVQTGDTWSVGKDYYYREGMLLAASAPSGLIEHFSIDHLGTPRLITDQNHNKIGFHVYFPYGIEWFAVGQHESPAETMRFTGHERDKDLTGNGDFLDYMHARYYSALQGRFLSIDPMLGDPGTPQSWNRYTYARNNPILYSDPTGEFVDVSALDARQRSALLQGLADFTGNTYAIVENRLVLVSVGANSSASASDFLNGLIGDQDKQYLVVPSTNGKSQYNPDEQRVEINFAAFEGAIYNGVNPNTFNLGSTLIHELAHQVTGLHDTPDGMPLTMSPPDYTWTGPIVDFVNTMRSERGLPTRAAYNAEPVRAPGFRGLFLETRHAIRFFDPQSGRTMKVIRNGK
jgi:RHS repeat-associated protein